MSAQRVARGPQDLPDPGVLRGLSGLDIMREMLAGRVAAPTISALLDYRLHAVDMGRVAFRGRPAFAHTNPMGGVHGGWYGTILDSALGCAVMTTLPPGRAYTTLEYKVNLTRAIPLGTEVEAVGTVAHAGRTTAVATATLCGVADGRVYATGSTTCLIMDRSGG